MQRELDRMFAERGQSTQAWRAALAPHAGWVYSGHIAAAVFQRIKFPESTIILCPKHTHGGAEWAIAPYVKWQMPGGELVGDVELAEHLADGVDGWQIDARPHEREHAIEVQLPLLARMAPNLRIVGVTVGRCDFQTCLQFAAGLTQVIKDRVNSILLIVSSDMNHFGTDSENRRLDAMAIEALEHLDPQQLYTTCRQHNITMCGMLPAVIVLETLRKLDLLHHCERVAYATSADVSGDTNRVVGYAGMLFD